MRIQRTNFLLKLDVKYTGSMLLAVVNGVSVSRQRTDDIETLHIMTTLPNKLMLRLSDAEPNSSIELMDMWLAGIRLDQKLLANLPEYTIESPASMIKKTKLWDQPGCVVFDLFNPDPFAYHLYIGNKIKFII